MAGKNISFTMSAKDEATGKINKLSGSINTFAKDVKQTLKPLDNFGKSLKSLGSMGLGLATIKGGFDAVANSIKSVVSSMLEMESKFAEADQVIRRIDFAGTINKELGMTSEELKKFADETSASLKNAISSDAINAEIASLSFDKTGDQIKEIISVALDLSAALGTDLSTAVQQVNQTFSGSVGTLGKYFPELKNISKEALASGEALTLLKSKVSGLSLELSNSAQGSIDGYKNSVENLKESIGGLVTDFIQPLRNALASLFAELTNDFNKFDQKLKERKRIESGGATLEEAQQQLALWQGKLNTARTNKDSREAWGKKTGANLQVDYYYQQYSADLAEAQKQVNAYINMVAEIRKAQQSGALATPQDFLTTTPTSSGLTGSSNLGTESHPLVVSSYDIDTEAWDSFFAGINAGIQKQKEEAQKQYEEEKRLQREQIKLLNDMAKNAVLNNTGELGNYIRTALETGPYGVVAQLAGDILAKMSEESGIINTFFNSITYFIDQFIGPLVKLIEPIVLPVLAIVKGMGEMIAAQLSLQQPFMDYVAGVLRVVGAAVYWVQSFYTNIIDLLDYIVVEIENGFISLYNSLNGWGQDKSYKSSRKDWNSIEDTFKLLFSADFYDYYKGIINEQNSSLSYAASASGSNSARYTAERDVIVNINVSNSFINGSAREIALAIEEELKSAHALGY